MRQTGSFKYLGAQPIAWPDQLRGPWEVTVHFGDLGDGVAAVVGLDVRSFRLDGDGQNPGPIRRGVVPRAVNVSLLRRMNLTDIIKLARSWQKDLRKHFARDPATDQRVREAALSALPAFEESPRQPGRPALSAEQLNEAARIYVEALNDGRSDPTKAVAEELSIGRSTAGKWVMRARQAGLLEARAPRRPDPVPMPTKKKGRRQ